MRLSINKNLRIGLIVLLVIIIGGASFLLYREVKHPGFQEQSVPVYSYNNKATVDYRVYFKPNDLYEAGYMDEEQIYLTELVDHIKANFNYEFTADKAASLEGTYNIIAKVQGYITDRDDKITKIWEKDFVLVPSKKFTINSETVSLKESVNIPLGEYNAFAAKILSDSKSSCETSLNVLMNIKLKGDTGVGELEENITPSLIVPLNTPTIEITGNREIDQPGAIEETTQVQLPIDRKMVVIYGIIIGISALGIGFFVFFTEADASLDPFKKELRKLFKKHGDRFVALNSEIETADGNITSVKSMDDLVRVADELMKPILYRYSSDYRDINRFYVVDGDNIYMLDLYDTFSEEGKGKTYTS